MEIRTRDTRLQPFYKSKIWFRKACVWYYSTWGNLQAGKIYPQVGKFWDGTFWGNLLYFNGLKLNPDYGLAWSRQQPLSEKSMMRFWLPYFSGNDQVDGALQDRDVESDTGCRMLQAFTFRVQSRFYRGDHRSWSLGLSGLSEKIQSAAGPSFPLCRNDGNIAVQLHRLDLFGEILNQKGQYPLPNKKHPDSKGCVQQLWILPGSTNLDLSLFRIAISEWQFLAIALFWGTYPFSQQVFSAHLQVPVLEKRPYKVV